MGFRSFLFSYFLKLGCLFFLQGIFKVYIIGGKDILISESITNKFNFAEKKNVTFSARNGVLKKPKTISIGEQIKMQDEIYGVKNY